MSKRTGKTAEYRQTQSLGIQVLVLCGLFAPCVSLSKRQGVAGHFLLFGKRSFFYHLKGVEKYESEIYLSRLWDPFGL